MAKAPALKPKAPAPAPKPQVAAAPTAPPVEEEVVEEEAAGDAGEGVEGVDTGEGEEPGVGMVNLTDVDDSGKFVAVPRGTYECEVSNLTYETSSKGNLMWSWGLTVIQEGEYTNRKSFYHTTFNEGGLPRVKRALARIVTDTGYEKEILIKTFNPETVAMEGRLIGARCKVRVDTKMYEGSMRNNVKDVLPPGETSFMQS